jgi:hypothetical protein
MCDDCQAYARYLGHPDAILDANGGTDFYYPTPAQFVIRAGRDQLRCVRLSARGLLRWYTACCRTPVAHTVDSGRVPFVGVPRSFIALPDDAQRTALLGPISFRVRARYGKGTLPRDASPGVPLRALLLGYTLLLFAWLRRKHKPSPFFDDRGQPVIGATILSSAEREALR